MRPRALGEADATQDCIRRTDSWTRALLEARASISSAWEHREGLPTGNGLLVGLGVSLGGVGRGSEGDWRSGIPLAVRGLRWRESRLHRMSLDRLELGW
jgi:hypothetical protein